MTITLLESNTRTWTKYKQLIRSAKKSIFMVLWYVFESDPFVNKIEKLLKKQLKNNVKVTIIYTNNLLQIEEMVLHQEQEGKVKTDKFIASMTKAGAETINFSEGNNRGTHRKALIIDDERGIIGSRNLNKFYYRNPETNPYAHMECDLLIEDEPLIKSIKDLLFIHDNVHHQIDPSTHFVQCVPKEKWRDFMGWNDNIIEDKYVELINASKKSITLVNVSSDFRSDMKSAIINALKRDVKITIYANNQIQIQSQADSSILFFETLLNYKGFTLYENMTEHLLHSKYAVFDHKVICIGSFNFDEWSYNKNAELLLIRRDEILAESLLSNAKSIRKNFVHKTKFPELKSILHRLDLIVVSNLIHLGSLMAY